MTRGEARMQGAFGFLLAAVVGAFIGLVLFSAYTAGYESGYDCAKYGVRCR